MNSPNYPPPGGPQGPYGPPPGQPPYGQRPPQTPPGGQPYGGPPPQGPPYGAPPPQGPPVGGPGAPGPGGPGGPGGFGGPGGPVGGPPPGGPGGAPPASYPPPPPPAPSSKPKSVFQFIKIGIVVVVVAIGAVVYFVTRESAPDNAAVGDCIKVNSATISNADVEKVECTDAAATYKVGATFDSSTATCPGGDNANYISYTQTGRGSNLTLCLILNAKKGECYEEGSQVDTKVDCGASNATFQVLEILTNTADDAQCPEGTQGSYVYPEPKPGTVQCLVQPGGSGGPAGT